MSPESDVHISQVHPPGPILRARQPVNVVRTLEVGLESTILIRRG